MTVVAWLDADGRTGLCARCVPGLVAQQPGRADLTPVGVEQARGKACVVCNLPLAYEPGSPAAQWGAPRLDEMAERARESLLADEEQLGDWAADAAREERWAA